MFSIIGAVWFLNGTHRLRVMAFPLFLLFFMVPIPAIVYNQITFPLQLLASRTAGYLREGMRRVVEEGTARALAAEDLSIAGKTGTAQTPGGPPHSWFIGFAPDRRPRIAFAVVVEHGGAGSQSAAPLAARLVRHWLASQEKDNERAER